MRTEKSLFAYLNDEEISIFELENDKGMIVKIMDFGATITSVSIPEKQERVELVCGFDELKNYFSDEYMNNAPYFGATIGRYCSQIKDSEFILKGKEILLAANCEDNNLHGGVRGFDKQRWNGEVFEEKDCVGVEFQLDSPHGDEGFPGNIQAKVKMSLTNENEIKIHYTASTSRITPISMTNHSYFNLSGFKDTIEKHLTKIFSKQLLEIDETGAATGTVVNVEGTDVDLQKGKIVKDVHDALGDGLEHFYIFDNPEFKLNKVAEISDPESGRSLEVLSQEPCMLFYTSKNMSDSLKRENGDQFGKYRGFTCETHRWPNGPNIENSPGTYTTPDKPFDTTTIFKLNW